MSKILKPTFEVVKRYAPLLILLLLLALIFIGQYKKIVNKIFPPKVNKDEQAQKVLKNQPLSEAEKDALNLVAMKLANDLGTSYSWYDPRSWTENDKEIYLAVKDLSHTQFRIVATLYHNVYTNGKNLSEDLSKLLDSKYYKLLKVK